MENASSLNWLDIFLAIIIVVSAVTGLRAGFTRVVIGLTATVVGLLAGFWCYRLVGAELHHWISSVKAADIVGFFLIFCGVAIAGVAVGGSFLVQPFAGRAGGIRARRPGSGGFGGCPGGFRAVAGAGLFAGLTGAAVCQRSGVCIG
jgi:hypothetical protein